MNNHQNLLLSYAKRKFKILLNLDIYICNKTCFHHAGITLGKNSRTWEGYMPYQALFGSWLENNP